MLYYRKILVIILWYFVVLHFKMLFISPFYNPTSIFVIVVPFWSNYCVKYIFLHSRQGVFMTGFISVVAVVEILKAFFLKQTTTVRSFLFCVSYNKSVNVFDYKIFFNSKLLNVFYISALIIWPISWRHNDVIVSSNS